MGLNLTLFKFFFLKNQLFSPLYQRVNERIFHSPKNLSNKNLNEVKMTSKPSIKERKYFYPIFFLIVIK